ncbi:hypothetical protein LEP1GSC005_1382 [Leptospira santarosai str. ST188]|nr:hypothetical protein LEP1GSC005_1382 [Leptospira santarosai str. ST188]
MERFKLKKSIIKERLGNVLKVPHVKTNHRRAYQDPID